MRLAGLLIAIFCAVPLAAPGDTLVATRTIRAHALIGPEDIALRPVDTPGALTDPAEAVGLEARAILYPGRPVRRGDVGAPALVERNEIVTIVFARGALSIRAEGRALGRGGAGDHVRVMNLASRNTITGVVEPDGRVSVADALAGQP